MPIAKHLLPIVIVSFCIGVANEVMAALTSVWIYNPWWLTFVNLFLMFVIIMPLVVFLLQEKSGWLIFLVGFAIGLIYEFSDQYFLHWASFPNGKFLFLENIIAIRIVIALLWGLVPLVTRWMVNFWMAREG